MMTFDIDDDWLSIPDTCADLKKSKPTIYDLLNRRELESVKDGKRRYVLRRSIQAYKKRIEARYSPLPMEVPNPRRGVRKYSPAGAS